MARRTRSRANAGVLKLATEARGWFTFSGEAPENGQRPNIWTRREGAPAWTEEMVREAHGTMLPEDHRYAMCVEALDAIVSAGGDEDNARDEMMQGGDIYNADLLEWLASHLERAGYCDEARDDGLVADDADIMSRISAGQARERDEVFSLVWQYLDGKADEMAENDDGDDGEAD